MSLLTIFFVAIYMYYKFKQNFGWGVLKISLVPYIEFIYIYTDSTDCYQI